VPKPWTDDEILQNYFFTNPYRENDKTTTWVRMHIGDPWRDDPAVLLATTIFRWFNFIPTAEVLMGGPSTLLLEWSEPELARLSAIRNAGGQVFTGAFMVNSPPGEPKVEAICRRITRVWKSRDLLIRRSSEWRPMQLAHAELTSYDGLGGRGAYEIVCDLRYTRFLEHATDKSIWSNLGPGAVRGLYRVLGRELTNKSIWLFSSGCASCLPVRSLLTRSRSMTGK
jgi:alpha-glutamyl/putrescinyl thymine pyrophosphorylase clade 1